MCSDAELSDKEKYPTFARTFAVDSQVVPSVVSLVKNAYRWTRVAIIYESTSRWEAIKNTLRKSLEEQGVVVAVVQNISSHEDYIEGHEKQVEQYKSALRTVKRDARSESLPCFHTCLKEKVGSIN